MLKVYNCIPNYRGQLPPDSIAFPVNGGSGTNGSIMAGDAFTVTSDATFNKLKVRTGDVITAFVNRPGQRVANWRAVRNEVKDLIDENGQII